MSRRLRIMPQAARELAATADYLGLHAGLALSRRFQRAFRNGLDLILDNLDLGSPWEYDEPRLAGLRVWAVPKFRNYLVLYRTTDDFIDVIHLFHGSQDIEHRLDEFS